jgi:hypothetical protein
VIRIAGYLMDLAVREGHRFPGEATKRPVESGGDITDHIRDLPHEITLDCIVSDTPIGAVAVDRALSQVFTGDAEALPSEAALAKLREIKAAERPVTIETSLGTWESMALVDLDVPRSKEESGGLFFTARFEHVRVVTNKRTRTRVSTPMAGAGGPAKAVKKKLDDFVQVNDRILWRRGRPPGGPLPTPFGWAYVIGTRTTVARENTSDQRLDRDAIGTDEEAEAKNIVYRYTGEASPDQHLDDGYFGTDEGAAAITPGKRLTDREVAAFRADLARDVKEYRRSQEADRGKDRDMPHGLSKARFGRRQPIRSSRLPGTG